MKIGIIAVGRSGEEARHQIDITPDETINDLYKKAGEAFDKNPKSFRLTYMETPLTDRSQKISTLGLKEADNVYMSIVAHGGK